MAIIMPLFMLIVYAGMIAIYYIGANSQFDAMLYLENFATSIDPKISVGEMEKATTYIMMIMSSLLMIGMTFANMARAAASGKRINEVLETPDIICDGNLDVTTLKETGTIEFKNVDFAYPNASASVLENINLKIEKGETVAIVGATGSGKTTLVNLITRFYDVTKGEILVDGENIKNYKLVDLRNKIAIVLQKAELFAGTIKEIIKWGNPNATYEEVEWAANIAQAIEFIDSKEKKFDEYVEEKGTSLSGGQRQRLSIARAIVKKAIEEKIEFEDLKEFKAIAGLGVEAIMQNNDKYLIGNRKLMTENGVIIPNEQDEQQLVNDGNSILFVSLNNKLVALIGVKDILKDNIENVIKELKDKNINVVMLTGDNEKTAEIVAKQIGIEKVISNVTPKEKAEKI